MSTKKQMPDYFRRRNIRTERYFLKKSKGEQREIIKKPWTRPMAAQHLAAIKIQRHVRSFLAFLQKHPELRKRRRKGGKGYDDEDVSQPDTHFTPSQKLRAKFLTSSYNILHKSEEG